MEFDSIQVLIGDVRGVRHSGRIRNLWHGAEGVSVSIAFPSEKGPSLPLGRAARVSFLGGPLPTAIEAPGLVVSRSEERDSEDYHLRFGEAASPVLGPLLETRRAPRVSPPADQAISIGVRTLEGGAAPVVCELIDISIGGVGLGVPLLHETQLAAAARVRLAIPLPGHGDPVVLDAEVRHRILDGNRVIYGVEFDTPDGGIDARHGRVARYVHSRLAEMRRGAKTSSSRSKDRA